MIEINQKPLGGELIDYGCGLAPNAVCLLMNEGSGNTISDLSGNKITGTFANTPVWTSGKYGAAIDFERADSDYIDCGSSLVLAPSSQITIIAAIKTESTGSSLAIMGRGGNTAETESYEFQVADDNQLQVYMTLGGVGSGWQQSGTTITTGQHHIVAFRYTGSSIDFFIDGVQTSNSGTKSGAMHQGVHNARIGRQGDASNYFDGLIEFIYIYRALSASEIALLSHYPFIIFGRRRRIIYDEIVAGLGIPIVMHHRKLLEAA